MGNLVVSPVDQAYTYELEGDRWNIVPRFAAKPLANAFALPKVTPKSLPWDGTITVTAGQLALAAAGAALAERLMDGAGQVINELDKVVRKLDEILNEIRALREFIREQDRAHWRSVLESEVGAYLGIAGNQLSAAKNGVLPELEHKRFSEAISGLMFSLERISNFSDAAIGKRVSLPLYAGVKAGILMLAAGDKFLQADPTARVNNVKSFEPLFVQWRAIVKEMTDSTSRVAQSKVEFLNGFTKTAVIGVGGRDGVQSLNYLDTMPRATFIYLTIHGSPDEPFRIERMWVEPVDTLNLAVRRYFHMEVPDAQQVPRFPLPWVAYFPSGNLDDNGPHPNGTEVYVGGLPLAQRRAAELVADLNAKRDSLFNDDLAQIADLGALTEGLTKGFDELVEVARSEREDDPP